MAFPTREFGGQEFKTDEEIQAFAAKKNFPGVLMKLGKVQGNEASEVWKFFKQETGAADPGWNLKASFWFPRLVLFPFQKVISRPPSLPSWSSKI